MKGFHLGKIMSGVPPHARPIVYGGMVGVPLGIFLLVHKTKPNTSGAANTSGTLSYNGTGIPLGAPENRTYIDRTITKYVPVTKNAGRAGVIGWWEGYAARILKKLGNTNNWIAHARKTHNTKWLAQLEKQKAGLQRELSWAHWNIGRAKAGKPTSREPGAPGRH